MEVQPRLEWVGASGQTRVGDASGITRDRPSAVAQCLSCGPTTESWSPSPATCSYRCRSGRRSVSPRQSGDRRRGPPIADRLKYLSAPSSLYMKIGLVGFAGSGKTTVFNTMTGLHVPVGYGGEVRLGTVRVPD